MRLIVFTSIFEQKKRSQLNFEESFCQEQIGENCYSCISISYNCLVPCLGTEHPRTQASSPENEVLSR